MLRNELLLVVELEKFLKLGLIKDNNLAVNNSSFVAFWDLDCKVGSKWFKAFAVEFPAELAFQSSASGEVLCDIESFLAVITRITKLRDDTFNAFEFVLIISEVGDVFIFILNEMN